MKKMEKPPPPNVLFAILCRDKGALSRMGRHGAMVKKELAAKDRERKIQFMLACAKEIARQANEHICPLV